jgi:hypothetical protein
MILLVSYKAPGGTFRSPLETLCMHVGTFQLNKLYKTAEYSAQNGGHFWELPSATFSAYIHTLKLLVS